MKVSLDSPQLVTAMLACFFGDGPKYMELMKREKPEDDYSYDDDDVKLEGGPLPSGILTPGGDPDKWEPQGVLIERAEEDNARSDDAA